VSYDHRSISECTYSILPTHSLPSTQSVAEREKIETNEDWRAILSSRSSMANDADTIVQNECTYGDICSCVAWHKCDVRR
jgi:hypothetical protein